MTRAVRDIGRKLPLASTWFRTGLWLIVAVLTLQLVGSTYHKHKVAAQSCDSVSGYIAAHLPPDTSTAVSHVFAARTLYFCATGPFAAQDFISQHDYFIPRAHAPPLRSLPL